MDSSILTLGCELNNYIIKNGWSGFHGKILTVSCPKIYETRVYQHYFLPSFQKMCFFLI